MHNKDTKARPRHPAEALPLLLSAHEVAGVLRTTRRAVYAMAARGELPGLVRIGRRLRVDSDVLVGWLNEKRAVSSEE